MFGYVKVFRPELKVCEYEQYKGVYCSLCQTLGKRYGFASRMTLSYDFAFLALFLMSLNDETPSFVQGRCPFHPLKKRSFCGETEALRYSADVAVLLTYHKLCDTIQDERFVKRTTARLLKWLYSRDYKKAALRRPKEAQAAERFMREQFAIEHSVSPCLDACAEPTARFLSVLASSNSSDDTRECASRFGYCLGRFIYLADAAEDLEEDIKNGSFNPFLLSCDRSADCDIVIIRQYAIESLHTCVAACVECLEGLPIRRFKGIINNVLFQGLPCIIKQICIDKQEESGCEKSV